MYRASEESFVSRALRSMGSRGWLAPRVDKTFMMLWEFLYFVSLLWLLCKLGTIVNLDVKEGMEIFVEVAS